MLSGAILIFSDLLGGGLLRNLFVIIDDQPTPVLSRPFAGGYEPNPTRPINSQSGPIKNQSGGLNSGIITSIELSPSQLPSFGIGGFGKVVSKRVEGLFWVNLFHEPVPRVCATATGLGLRLLYSQFESPSPPIRELRRWPIASIPSARSGTFLIRVNVLWIADRLRTNGSLNHILRIIPHRALYGRDFSSAQFIVHRYCRNVAHIFPLSVHCSPAQAFVLTPPNYDSSLRWSYCPKGQCPSGEVTAGQTVRQI